jgi:hypothetical protein
MKRKTLVLALILTTLLSCNKDNTDENVDNIIGKWSWIQRFDNGVKQNLDDCYKNNNIEFKSNETYINTTYDLDQTCEQLTPITGTWENLGSGNYRLTYDNGLDSQTTKFSFQNDTFSFEDTDGNTTIKFVYQKVAN